MKNQIETQEHWATLRCYKILKETISEEAFYQIIMCKVDTLSISTKISSRIRDDLDEERYERRNDLF
jgi:hypothetical protein